MDMPLVSLRPITILLGRNSAGKSTFLRSFSLLRQSIEARSSAAILWYGSYVDFGDFKSAVHLANTDNEIVFKFKIEDLETRSREDDFSYGISQYEYLIADRLSFSGVNIEVAIGQQLQRTVRRNLKLSVDEHKISVVAYFGRDGRVCERFTVNDQEIRDLIPGHDVVFSGDSIFSRPYLAINQKIDNRVVRRSVSPASVFTSAIIETIKPLVDPRITVENIRIEALKLLLWPTLKKSTLKELAQRSNIKSFQKLYEKWTIREELSALKKINSICAFNYSLASISRVFSVLSDLYASTTYLGPARARSERYYRSQELEVSEIAPDGQNLPVFFASLSLSEMRAFSEWVSSLFNFGVSVTRHEGHISIQLEQDKFSVNVADTGYGISQILPVLAQTWWASRTRNRITPRASRSRVIKPITMEQPELHLHPAHQSKLADVFVSAIRDIKVRVDPVFVIETHSEAFINRLGELVSEGRVSSEDITIVIFSSDDRLSSSNSISVARYDEAGVLIDWPFGFFSY